MLRLQFCTSLTQEKGYPLNSEGLTLEALAAQNMHVFRDINALTHMQQCSIHMVTNTDKTGLVITYIVVHMFALSTSGHENNLTYICTMLTHIPNPTLNMLFNLSCETGKIKQAKYYAASLLDSGPNFQDKICIEDLAHNCTCNPSMGGPILTACIHLGVSPLPMHTHLGVIGFTSE